MFYHFVRQKKNLYRSAYNQPHRDPFTQFKTNLQRLFTHIYHVSLAADSRVAMYSAHRVWFFIACISVVFVSINSTLFGETTVTKCCAYNEFLMQENSSYSCQNVSEPFVLPLKFNRIDYDTGIPENCSSKVETCLDKTVNNKIVELTCENEEVLHRNPLPIIYKCCPEDMFYNKTRMACDFDTFADQNLYEDKLAEVYNLEIGAPNCTGVLVDYIITKNFEIENGDLTWTPDGTDDKFKVKNGTYCIDRSRNQENIMLRKCEQVEETTCQSRTCVSKCCPHGHIYLVKHSQRAICVKTWNLTFVRNFQDVHGNIITRPSDVAILPPPMCANKKYLINRHEYSILPNGTLVFGKSYLNASQHQFCIENTLNPHGNTLMEVALICFPAPASFSFDWLHFAGLMVSILFLTLTLFVYFMLPELQNLHGKTVMCHTVSLLIAYIFLALVKRPLTTFTHVPCYILGYCILFNFAAAFSWLNVMCFDIWWTFGTMNVRLGKSNKAKRFVFYCLYAYTVALVLTSIAVTCDHIESVPVTYRTHIGKRTCWFEPSELGHTLYFIMPMGFLISCNLVLFILTAKHCFKIKADIARMRDTDHKKKRFLAARATLIMNIKLFIVMGITWMFEFISAYITEPVWLWMILDTLNSLQGLWIFCIFVIKDKVWKSLRHQLGYRSVDNSQNTQTTNTSTHKNSVCSMTSLKLNGIKPEEMELIQNSLKKSSEWSKENETAPDNGTGKLQP